MRSTGTALIITLMLTLFFTKMPGQSPAQQMVNAQSQSWFSVNTISRFNQHWGLNLDLHLRRSDFLADPLADLLLGGINYWIKSYMTVALGYAHVWAISPLNEDSDVVANENRIYQQFAVGSQNKRLSILQRLRNEQRWQQKVTDGKLSDDWRFTERIRYLFSMTYAISESFYVPSIVLADEVMLQFGKEVVYNTFDQNRIFLGIKQNISTRISADFGYMMMYQQKNSGYQYDLNHTMRLFFYYNIGWKPDNLQKLMESAEE